MKLEKRNDRRELIFKCFRDVVWKLYFSIVSWGTRRSYDYQLEDGELILAVLYLYAYKGTRLGLTHEHTQSSLGKTHSTLLGHWFENESLSVMIAHLMIL